MSDILDTLDLSQRETLNQFQAITQSNDLEASIKILGDYQWNLERSIQRFYEGGSTNTTLESPSASSSLTPPARPLVPPPSSNNSNITSSNTTPANSNTNNRRHRSGIMALFMWPFGLAWNITWTLLSFASRLISRRSITSSQHHQQQQQQDPRSLANKFLREFEKKYGETHVPFLQEGYSQALEKARKDLKFLLVILQSDEHDNTESFCKNTLTDQELIHFLQSKNILTWGGNVGRSEGYQVSCTLQATTYPFLAVIALQQSSSSTSSSPKMSVVERLEGPITPTTLMQRLDSTIQRHGTVLNRLKMERDQREMERRLREEQDRAYHESLKADQEKERKAREECEALARQEEEERKAQLERELQLQKREQYIQYLYATLPTEPGSDYKGKATKLNFRLANGDRVIRQFKSDDTIESLYQFVEAYPLIKNNNNITPNEQASPPMDYEHKYNFTIHSPFPRTVYDLDDKHKPLSDVPSLWPSATLIVELDDIEEDDEDDI